MYTEKNDFILLEESGKWTVYMANEQLYSNC